MFGVGIISGYDAEILEKTEDAIQGLQGRKPYEKKKKMFKRLFQDKARFKGDISDILFDACIITEEQIPHLGLSYYIYSNRRDNVSQTAKELILPEEIQDLTGNTEFDELCKRTEQQCESSPSKHNALVLIPKSETFNAYIKQCFTLSRDKRPSS